MDNQIHPPSAARPCYVCGTTNPADHGPRDECPDLAADREWLDAQLAREAQSPEV